MRQHLKICIAKKMPADGVVSFRTLSVREKILRRILGDQVRTTIIVPGDSVEALEISELREGGKDDDKEGI